MTDFLEKICREKRNLISKQKRKVPISVLETHCGEVSAPRGFLNRLHAKVIAGQYGLIAEIKKASPSKGVMILWWR